MGINIGNGNKIKNSNIAEKIEGDLSGGNRRFYEKTSVGFWNCNIVYYWVDFAISFLGKRH